MKVKTFILIIGLWMTYESLDVLSELFGTQTFSYAYLSLGPCILAEIMLVMIR